jgi:HD superfamily phosphohydrolase YqeK
MSLFTSLSPEELHDHLQFMDDVEMSVRVARNSLLPPPLSNVYKLLHRSVSRIIEPQHFTLGHTSMSAS